jgi:hypothetical protein
MPYSVIVYPDPLAARVVLTPDYSGVGATGTPYTHTDGRQGQICTLPDDVPDEQGAAMDVTLDGYVPMRVRGFLKLNPATKVARLQVDDYNLVADPNAGSGGGGSTGPSDRSPEEIINDVFNRTHPDLASHEGCGRFTEDVCEALHIEHSQKWGHVAKNPGQNQYNGHAVDAVILLGDAKQTTGGTYDIIQNSVSVSATPAFNYVGPADPNLWYYPPEMAAVRYQVMERAQRKG